MAVGVRGGEGGGAARGATEHGDDGEDGGEPGRLPRSQGGRRTGTEGDVDRHAEDGRSGIGLACSPGPRRQWAARGRSRETERRPGESPIAAREPATRSAELCVTMRANHRARRDAARQALEQFEPQGGSGHGLALAPDAFDASEVEAITERYYELALILADATSQPIASEETAAQAREALGILDRIERVRPPTKVF